MSSIPESSLPSLGAPVRRPAAEAKAVSAPPAAADRLQAKHRPEKPPEPGELVARLKALQAPDPVPAQPAPPRRVPVSQRVRRSLDPQGVPDRARDYVAPLLNLTIGVLTSPRYAVKRLQGAIKRSFQLVQGAGHARELVQDFRLARRQGQGLRFVRGHFEVLKWRTASRAREAIKLAKARQGKGLMSLLSRREVKDVALNKGMLGFYRSSRATGAGPLTAVWRGFTRTVETGGRMPAVAQQAAQMGGRWGKALTWTGRIGRVAPLLNVPLAIFDLKEVWSVYRHPNATTQDKISKTGQAALTSAAAGLAVAGFLSPPPLNAALLTASGAAGIASTLWGVATSEVAHRLFKKVGGFFGGLGRRLGLG